MKTTKITFSIMLTVIMGLLHIGECSQTRSMAINSTYFAMMVTVGMMVSFR